MLILYLSLMFILLQVQSAADFYTWLNYTLIPFVFPKQSVDGTNLPAYYRQYLQDQVNFRVGPLRLRQVRTTEGESDGYNQVKNKEYHTVGTVDNQISKS